MEGYTHILLCCVVIYQGSKVCALCGMELMYELVSDMQKTRKPARSCGGGSSFILLCAALVMLVLMTRKPPPKPITISRAERLLQPAAVAPAVPVPATADPLRPLATPPAVESAAQVATTAPQQQPQQPQQQQPPRNSTALYSLEERSTDEMHPPSSPSMSSQREETISPQESSGRQGGASVLGTREHSRITECSCESDLSSRLSRAPSWLTLQSSANLQYGAVPSPGGGGGGGGGGCGLSLSHRSSAPLNAGGSHRSSAVSVNARGSRPPPLETSAMDTNPALGKLFSALRDSPDPATRHLTRASRGSNPSWAMQRSQSASLRSSVGQGSDQASSSRVASAERASAESQSQPWTADSIAAAADMAALGGVMVGGEALLSRSNSMVLAADDLSRSLSRTNSGCRGGGSVGAGSGSGSPGAGRERASSRASRASRYEAVTSQRQWLSQVELEAASRATSFASNATSVRAGEEATGCGSDSKGAAGGRERAGSLVAGCRNLLSLPRSSAKRKSTELWAGKSPQQLTTSI